MLKKLPLGYLYIAPFFIFYILLQVYPMLYSVYLSMTKFDGFNDPVYIGSVNYLRLFHDVLFWQSVFNTIRNWVIAFTLQITFALVLSAIFTYSKLKGLNFFRALFYFPNFVTAATVAVIFSVIFRLDGGVFNELLMKLGIIDEPVYWLRSKMLVATATPLIIWWLWFGQTTIIICAGLTSISKDYFDAALLDGATPVESYWHITLPLVRPTLLYVLITSLIGGMQHYDVAALLTTEGNPGHVNQTMLMYMYNQAFTYSKFGYASTVAIGIFVVIQIGAGSMLFWYNKKQKG